MNPEPFQPAPFVLPPDAPLTWLERIVMRLGGPDRVTKACDVMNVVIIAYSAAFILMWTALFGPIGLFNITTGWPPARITVVSFSYIPFLAFQLILGGLRYACVTLWLKAAEHNAKRFSEGLPAFMDRLLETSLDDELPERPKPPTLN